MCHVCPHNVTWFLKWQVPLRWASYRHWLQYNDKAILMDWNYVVHPGTLLELKQFRETLRFQRIILAVTLQNVQIKNFTVLTKYSFRMESHKVTVLVYGT